MPGKIKGKTFCPLPSSLVPRYEQRAPYPRPAAAHFSRIPKQGVGEPRFGVLDFKREGMKLMLDIILL